MTAQKENLKLTKNRLNNMIGMTLMEIMIVMVILGLLLATLVPGVMEKYHNSQVKQTKITLGQIIQAINAYQVDCGKYPANLEALKKQPSECANWGPDPYMKKIPQDAFGHDFTYEVSDNSYVLKSPGYKGKEISSEDLQ